MRIHLIPTLFVAIVAGFAPQHLRAESVIVQWEKIYNGPGLSSDQPTHVAVDSAGNVVVTGRSGIFNETLDRIVFTGYTAKYAGKDGALIWEKRNASLLPSELAVDGDDNVLVTGGGDPSGYHTVKYGAEDGALLWEKLYNGPRNSDIAIGLAVDSEENVIVTGTSWRNAGGNSALYTAKYAAANGAVLWQQIYDAPGTTAEVARDVAVDTGGNAIITGYSGANSSRSYYTAKYAATDGVLLWERRYDEAGTSNQAFRVVVDSLGNAIATGSSSNRVSRIDQYTAKYAAADGALLWEKRVTGPDPSYAFHGAGVVDKQDNVITAGSFVGGDHIYLAKYAAMNGALLWENRTHGYLAGENSVALDGAGNVVVTGFSLGIGGNEDIYTAKFAAMDGSLLWEKRYEGTGKLNDAGIATATDSAGGTIVVGVTNSNNTTPSGDFYTVKYAPAELDGDNDGLLDSWEITHFGSTSGQGAHNDTDADGSVELLELAFGTDPRKSEAGTSPAVIVENGYLTITLTKQPGVAYLVETGASLTGDFSATSTAVVTNTDSTLKVTDTVLIGTAPARFLRVQVSAAP